MGLFYNPFFILLICSYSGKIFQVNCQDSTNTTQELLLEAIKSPPSVLNNNNTNNNNSSTTVVSILNERPVNLSQMQSIVKPGPIPQEIIQNQADYYHSVAPIRHNAYPDLEYFGPTDKPSLFGLTVPFQQFHSRQGHHHQHQNHQNTHQNHQNPNQHHQNSHHNHQNTHQNHPNPNQHHQSSHQHQNHQNAHQHQNPQNSRLPSWGDSMDVMGIIRNFASQKREFMQRLRHLKYNYKNEEQVRRTEVRNPENGDFMTRLIRGVVQKSVNKFQKHTNMLEMTVQFRKEQLQTFLQIPLVASVMMGSEANNFQQDKLIQEQEALQQQLPHNHGRKMLDRFPPSYFY